MVTGASAGPRAWSSAVTCGAENSIPGLLVELLERLHVAFLDPHDRLRSAEEHEPAILPHHRIDVGVRLGHHVVFVPVDHLVARHVRISLVRWTTGPVHHDPGKPDRARPGSRLARIRIGPDQATPRMYRAAGLSRADVSGRR